jgi:YfiH family protein
MYPMRLPPLPDTFEWTQESWGPALRCAPLARIATHLFTTRQLELSSEGGLAQLTAAVGAARVVTLTQVHGRAVVTVRAGEPLPDGRPEADALVSNAPTVAIAVRAADCVPVLMADRVTGAVGAVHAGWRGTAARASIAALEAMADSFGSRAADLVAAIGPSIGPCCYEVGTDVVDAFAAAGHERYLIDRWFSSLPPRRGVFPPARRGVQALHLDVAGANRDQLVLAGVPQDQIFMAGLCTAEHLDVLTSYRAEKVAAGRMAAVIVASGDPVATARRIADDHGTRCSS